MLSQILDIFVPAAYAAEAVAPRPDGGGLQLIIMFAVFIAFVYFTIWRPQAKKAKEQQSMMDSLTVGDEVMTAGGLMGRIGKLTQQYMLVTVAANTDIWMQKTAVMKVMPKGTLKSIS